MIFHSLFCAQVIRQKGQVMREELGEKEDSID